MGWLFAVARGLQHGSRAVVLESMLPIAAGHALSIAAVVAAIILLSAFTDSKTLHWGAGAVLIGFGLYRLIARHRGRAGMQVGPGQLLVWSFFMATAHGAGLMLVPVLLAMPAGAAPHAMAHEAAMGHAMGVAPALAAVAIHTFFMLIVAGGVALAVYEWLGLSLLRRGWINFDFLWIGALLGVGVIVLATA